MKRYRINNWHQYNKALIQRGSITFWFDQKAISQWLSTTHTCQKGRPKIYSDEAILCALMVRAIFHLPLRALEGFLRALVQLLCIDLPIPCYTQICRRATSLGRLLKKLSHKRPTDIVFDSTGLKVYGEGEWKVRQHGASKRRTWRKLHIALDPCSQEIILCELTPSGAGDAKTAEKMVKKLSKRTQRIYGDGSYDSFSFRKKASDNDVFVIVPPPRNAVVRDDWDPGTEDRNKAMQAIERYGGGEVGLKHWKKENGYHRRSLVETAMFRLKTLMGPQLHSRLFANQVVESMIKCQALNKLTKLGMPDGVWLEN